MLVDIVAGYLGAGKTTLLNRFIEDDPEPARLVVLMNEFGELGIDGLLVAGANDVVELSSGCICCTLRTDFRTQIVEIARTLDPRRLLIEPTGVATVGQVLKALAHQDLTDVIDGIRVFVLVDATTFNERLRESPRFFTSQVSAADVAVLTKTDLIAGSRIPVLRAAVESLAPEAWVVEAVRGHLPADTDLPTYRHVQDVPDSEVLEGMASLSYSLPADLSAKSLRSLFEALRRGTHGTVERAKAIAHTEEGWLRFDLAGPNYEEQPAGPAPDRRLVIIGQGLDTGALADAVERLEEATKAS